MYFSNKMTSREGCGVSTSMEGGLVSSQEARYIIWYRTSLPHADDTILYKFSPTQELLSLTVYLERFDKIC